MATGMKQVLVFLLLCCIMTVNGRNRPCTKGLDALNLFMDYKGCSAPDLWDISLNLTNLIESNMTVHNWEYIFTTYCRTVPHRMVECFEGNLQSCTADQRDALMKVAHQTGFVCQPNSTSLNPQIQYMLSQLSEEDMVQEGGCSGMNVRRIDRGCSAQVMTELGIASEEDLQRIKDLPIQQIVPIVQGYFHAYFRCLVTTVRDSPQRCAEWRGSVMIFMTEEAFKMVLGHNMTFAQSQLADMFDWEESTVQA